MRSRDLVLISICETKPPCSAPRSIAAVCGSSSLVAGVLTPFHTPQLIGDHSWELGHMTPMAVSTEPHFLVFRNCLSCSFPCCGREPGSKEEW